MQATHMSVIPTSNGIPQILHFGSLIHLIFFQHSEHNPRDSTISPQLQQVVGKQISSIFETNCLKSIGKGYSSHFFSDKIK
jgi:hypothetical protein